MTKGFIMEYFKNIDYMYNNPNMYDTLSRFLDELIEDTIFDFMERLYDDYATTIIDEMKGKGNDR